MKVSRALVRTQSGPLTLLESLKATFVRGEPGSGHGVYQQPDVCVMFHDHVGRQLEDPGESCVEMA
jgi:hypothetical protein